MTGEITVLDKCFDDVTEGILKELEKTRTKYWNLDRESANFLNMLIETSGAKNVLEIGTSNGYSGIWILKALENTKGKLTTIEYWEKRQSVARKNFVLCAPNVEVIPKIGTALIVLEDLVLDFEKGKIDKFDFVFIDASKKEYILYFELIDKILKPGGIILADNIISHRDKVKEYVDKLFSLKNYRSQILNPGTGMMFSRKMSD